MSQDKYNKKLIPAMLTASMSSEHASYKSTKRILSKLYTDNKNVLVGPGENAGIVDIGGDWAVALRIESHNHPSFIKPYDGAATGVGGILRDIFTMGARPIALLDILRFGDNANVGELSMRVVKGISDYGNCVGVPVVGGDVFSDATYNNNCLVNVCAVGLVKQENIILGNALTVGNDLIYVGRRTGMDGIGGSEMASKDLDDFDEDAIQDADPFLEKLLLEACCEMAEHKLVEGMQDMGAAGVLCSTTELVLRGRKKTNKSLGARVFLNKIPTQETMSPVDILLSESQERMMIASSPQKRNQILAIFDKWDLEAVVMGEITDDGKYTIVYDTEDDFSEELSMEFDRILPDLHEDWERKAWLKQGGRHRKWDKDKTREIWRTYDWMVGLRTLKGPDLPGSYAILDIPEVARKLIVSWSSDEGKSDLKPKEGIQYAFDNCLRYMKENQATTLAITNCLNFGHPEFSMDAFDAIVSRLSELCKEEDIPVISGNVSLYNAHKGVSIKPTPVLVMIGIIDN